MHLGIRNCKRTKCGDLSVGRKLDGPFTYQVAVLSANVLVNLNKATNAAPDLPFYTTTVFGDVIDSQILAVSQYPL